MRRINEEKLKKLSTTNEMLDKKYGVHGTETRNKFDESSIAYFYGNLLRNRRKELKMTQKEVAEKSGRNQSYIARIESGNADIQLTSFFRIASILGIRFIPTYL